MMNTTRWIRIALAGALVALLGACAHPINLEPKDLPERQESKLVAKKVAYVISDADRAKEVTSPGGGGDKVSYFPYRDMEKAIRSALRAVYTEVTGLKSGKDATGTDNSLVFTPTITTTSSSPSAFTWPPTKFTADLSCAVTDASGNAVTSVQAVGNGAAEFDEFKSDFSLSARRAVADAVAKLVEEIKRNDKLR
jgi:hypothetical protein